MTNKAVSPDAPSAIYASMSAVMADIDAIAKDSKNTQQGFMFRGIDAAYNAMHPLLAKHKIFTVPHVRRVLNREERATKSGGIISYTVLEVEYDFISGIDGSGITVGPIIGEGMDTGDKGCNKAMAVAHKYALFQTFLIPTEKAVDPDEESFEDVQPRQAARKDSDLWEDDDLDSQPEKPAKKAPAKKAADTDELAMPDEESAINIADVLINLAEGMHGHSVAALMDFWNKNKKVINRLDAEYPEQYQRVKAAFTALKNRIHE